MDFNKLEKELFGVMQKDDKYWRENDAKFRAAKQMASYEEFENIVKASHLKPLEKSDHVQELYRDGAKGNSLLNPVTGCEGMSSIEKMKLERKLNQKQS